MEQEEPSDWRRLRARPESLRSDDDDDDESCLEGGRDDAGDTVRGTAMVVRSMEAANARHFLPGSAFGPADADDST